MKNETIDNTAIDNTEKEIWKTCKDYPGFEVSSLGNVRRAAQEVYAITEDNNEKVLIATYPAKMINQFRNGPNIPEYSVNVGYGPAKKQVEVHRLVAETFLEKPDDGRKYAVHHINGDGRDNQVANLEFITFGDARKLKAAEKKDEDKPVKIHNGIRCITTNQYFSSIKATSQYFNIPYMQLKWYLTKTSSGKDIPSNWEYDYDFEKVNSKEIKKSIQDGSYVNVNTSGHDLITIDSLS